MVEVDPFDAYGALLPGWTIDEARLSGSASRVDLFRRQRLAGSPKTSFGADPLSMAHSSVGAPPSRPGQLVCTRDWRSSELWAVWAAGPTATSPHVPAEPDLPQVA